MKAVLVCVFLVLVFSCYAASDEAAHKAHVHEDKLADAEHYVDGEHNPEHDHEAFLGEEKEDFDHLSPEEAKKRLRNLIKKVDSDKDEAITTEELTDWVKKVFHERSLVGVDKDVEDKDSNKNGKVEWDEYVKGTYGEATGEDDEEMKELLERDRRRFDAADQDKDGALDKKEFGIFLHPESAPEMGDIHVTETIEDIDRDKDGFVNLKEFLGEYTADDSSETPEWVQEETKRFNEEYDKNKDGKLDKDEVKQWILPETDHMMALEEARHLVTSADENNDGKLTVEEIEKNYALFVGSEATDYGRALPHEEL